MSCTNNKLTNINKNSKGYWSLFWRFSNYIKIPLIPHLFHENQIERIEIFNFHFAATQCSLTLWLPQGFEKAFCAISWYVFFCSKIIDWRWSHVLSIFRSWDNFGVTGGPLVDNGSKEKILDMIGRGCTYFNVSYFLRS